MLLLGLLIQFRPLSLLELCPDFVPSRVEHVFFDCSLGVWLYDCCGGLCLGRSGIFDQHSFAKCPIFLQMLHCAPLAGQLMLCPCVNGAPRLQHGCMSCVDCCRCVLVCGRVWVRFVCCVYLVPVGWICSKDLLVFLASPVRERSFIPGRVCAPRRAAPFGWRSYSFSQ